MPYDVHLEIFEGPLDLLLYLIKKSDLEISEIPIAQITKEYLDYMEIMKELNLEIAGEFLVMASTLMQIKARMLLPSHEEEENEGPDPFADLKAKLIEYQKYKDVAKDLSQRESYFSDIYYKSPPTFDKDDYLLEASLFDLLSSFRTVLQELPSNVKEIVYEEIPIEQRIREILDMFDENDHLSFRDIFKTQTTKTGLILSFLAVLELIRLKQIIARQSEIFGEVRVYRVKDEVLQPALEAQVPEQQPIEPQETVFNQEDPNQQKLDFDDK